MITGNSSARDIYLYRAEVKFFWNTLLLLIFRDECEEKLLS
jgi:hypothetical protein